MFEISSPTLYALHTHSSVNWNGGTQVNKEMSVVNNIPKS
jgi:hypothetical protein